MKRILLILLMTLTINSMWSQKVGDTFESGNFKYKYTSVTGTDMSPATAGTVAVMGLSTDGKSATSLQIPVTVLREGYYWEVTCIENSAFKGNTNLTRVRIQYGTVDIKPYAFQNCTNVAEVLLPSSVMTIGTKAFDGCTKLKTVRCASNKLGTGELSYASDAFPNNSGMTLVLPRTDNNAVEHSHKELAFFNFDYRYISSQCYDVTRSTGEIFIVTQKPDLSSRANIKYGQGTIVGFEADGSKVVDGALSQFDGTYRTIGINSTYPISLRAIADSAFYGDTHLKSADFSKLERLHTIGNAAFENCENLNKITLNEGLRTIGKRAFAGSNISTCNVPTTVTDIGDEAFFDTRELRTLYLLNTGKHTGNLGFRFFGNNWTGCEVFVSASNFKTIYDMASNWIATTVDPVDPKAKVRPFLYSTEANAFQDVAFQALIDWNTTPLKVYVVTDVNESTNQVIATRVSEDNYTGAGTGVIVTGFEANKYYFLSGRNIRGTKYTGTSLLQGGPKTIQGQYQCAFLPESQTFKWYDGQTAIDDYRTYLVKADGTYFQRNNYQLVLKDNDGLTGDVDGNGEVDITDANILINIVLGKDQASNYGGRADLTGEGDIDVSDINTVLNIILGK